MTSEELIEHGLWHEHKATRCADHGLALGIVAAVTGIVVMGFILVGRLDLMLWALGIQLALATAQHCMRKRFEHHAGAALACYIDAEVFENNHKRRTHE